MNPLLTDKFNTPYETIPFSKIRNEHFIPAIKERIEQAKTILDQMKNGPAEQSFAEVIGAFEKAGETLEATIQAFYNLHSAESNDELRDLAKEFSPLLSEYNNDILLDAQIFEKVKSVYDRKDSFNLTPEEMTIIEDEYKSFVRNGALLDDSGKTRLREIDKRMSEITLKYSDNVLKDKNNFFYEITKEEDLAGLTPSYIEAAAELAKDKGKPGSWLVTLDFPSYFPFMQYSSKSELRKNLYDAYANVASKDDELDNQKLCFEITQLRNERANLLGYKSHAEFVLERRMAETPKKVETFLDDLLNRALPVAKEQMQELSNFKKELEGEGSLERWDVSYYSRLLKQKKYGFDPEELKPYFQLDKVIEGVFEVSSKLYNLNFVEINDIDKYHPDVKTYKVEDKDSGDYIGILYADFHPREGKRAGAWMCSYREQKYIDGQDRRPHVGIVCNFTKPTGSTPSLLTFGEVTTLFHEFGHGLHGLLSKCQYGALSGPNVYWDFVELPSQMLENWCYEKECLDLFAKHYESGESIPEDLINKLKSSQNYFEGVMTIRQLSFGLTDMYWHNGDPSKWKNVEELETKVLTKTNVFDYKSPPTGLFSTSFSHIFAGGYSAGYYSYKWAEVLDADAFEAFKEKGIFNSEVAKSFRENILEKGGTEPPMELYKRFRGKEPDVGPLLKRAGLS